MLVLHSSLFFEMSARLSPSWVLSRGSLTPTLSSAPQPLLPPPLSNPAALPLLRILRLITDVAKHRTQMGSHGRPRLSSRNLWLPERVKHIPAEHLLGLKEFDEFIHAGGCGSRFRVCAERLCPSAVCKSLLAHKA